MRFGTDSEGKVIYANKAVKRHYGMEPGEHIGKSAYDLVEGNWHPTMTPVVYKDKRRITYEQTLNKTGQKINTTVVPLLDENKEIDMVVFSVRDKLNARLSPGDASRAVRMDRKGLYHRCPPHFSEIFKTITADNSP